MKQIINVEYDEHQRNKMFKNKGQVLSPDGLRFICEKYHYDAEAIGKHFLELFPKICPEVNVDGTGI